MSPTLTAYGALFLAILCEIAATSTLPRTQEFTRLWPSVLVVICLSAAVYLLTLALRVLPLGVAYAVWSGVGITLTAILGLVLYGQRLDVAAVAGITLIVAGCVIMQAFSSVGH
ncbi:DMT family transporter [Mangrovicoccus algicola]|uniref:Multidrug efflux SMR transporter n=1 Tax=Mangrovicoccus algicola TaxID=2771008 RepID=A0A8J7CUS0_9RHOB|nr:multidrug efflux SMR transporter [Mangrovicoccus algicola]MBE3637859.1 multidrug efflux SMR transporter [Mangrovicoccus algicola]